MAESLRIDTTHKELAELPAMTMTELDGKPTCEHSIESALGVLVAVWRTIESSGS